MFDKMNFMIGALAAVVITVALFLMIFGIVKYTSTQYYSRFDDCIKAGGTWVPYSPGGYTAACVTK